MKKTLIYSVMENNVNYILLYLRRIENIGGYVPSMMIKEEGFYAKNRPTFMV